MTAAHTQPGSIYPGYVNVSAQTDGSVRIAVRSAPTKRNGVYICSNAVDKGKPGRCTRGDEHCNNYCNMAPEKGPMQDHPLAFEHVDMGAYAELTLSASEWDELKKQMP